MPLTKSAKPDAGPEIGESARGSAGTGRSRPGGSGVVRALRLLELIVEDGPLRFAALAERSELPKATLHRLLGELIDERLVQFDERAMNYEAGYRLLELANRVWSRSDIRELARDQLLALNALSGETVQIAVQADTHVVIIDHVESRESVRLSLHVGAREPLYCTSVGKVMLAWCEAGRQADIIARTAFARFTPNTITSRPALLQELSRVSKQGYAIDDEEHFLGTACVAAPIVDHAGQAVAGISISAPTFRVDRSQLLSWREPLVRAAADISRRLAPRTGPQHDSH